MIFLSFPEAEAEKTGDSPPPEAHKADKADKADNSSDKSAESSSVSPFS